MEYALFARQSLGLFHFSPVSAWYCPIMPIRRHYRWMPMAAVGRPIHAHWKLFDGELKFKPASCMPSSVFHVMIAAVSASRLSFYRSLLITIARQIAAKHANTMPLLLYHAVTNTGQLVEIAAISLQVCVYSLKREFSFIMMSFDDGCSQTHLFITRATKPQCNYLLWPTHHAFQC